MAPFIRAHAMKPLLKGKVVNLRQYIKGARQERNYWWEAG